MHKVHIFNMKFPLMFVMYGGVLIDYNVQTLSLADSKPPDVIQHLGDTGISIIIRGHKSMLVIW